MIVIPNCILSPFYLMTNNILKIQYWTENRYVNVLLIYYVLSVIRKKLPNTCVNPDDKTKTGFTQYLNKARREILWSKSKVGRLLCKSKYLRQIWIYTIIYQYLHFDVNCRKVGRILCKSSPPFWWLSGHYWKTEILTYQKCVQSQYKLRKHS